MVTILTWVRGVLCGSVLFLVAGGVAWGQIAAVVTDAVSDRSRVELPDSAGMVYRPVHYDPSHPPPVATTPPVVRAVRMVDGKPFDPTHVPVAELLAHPETSELRRADSEHVVTMWIRFAIPAEQLNDACQRRQQPNSGWMQALAPNMEDLDKVMAWLKEEGFTDVRPGLTDVLYHSVNFTGSVAVIERAFLTEVYSYTVNDSYRPTPTIPDTTYYTNGTNLSVPAAFSKVIGKVEGLRPVLEGGICNGIKAIPPVPPQR
jgi:Pro-kumamolisin, activation domain